MTYAQSIRCFLNTIEAIKRTDEDERKIFDQINQVNIQQSFHNIKFCCDRPGDDQLSDPPMQESQEMPQEGEEFKREDQYR